MGRGIGAAAAYIEEDQQSEAAAAMSASTGHQPMTMIGDWLDPFLVVAIVATLCFVVGAVSARLFMSSMRRDQMDVLLSRKMSTSHQTSSESRQSNIHSPTAVVATPQSVGGGGGGGKAISAMHHHHYAQDSSPTPPMVTGDDEEYSEGFDAADIMQATSKAAAVQHAMARRVEQRRTTSTLNAVGGDPNLIRSIVAASRAARAQQQQRGRTPPLKR
jgi:hypothetical protein